MGKPTIEINVQPVTVETVGEALKLLRVRKGLSAREVAKTAGLSYSTVYRAESGQEPSWATIVRLSRVVGVSLDTLARLVPGPEGEEDGA